MPQAKKKSIHILGICGTFMAGIARLALQMGYRVVGSDTHYYQPMAQKLQDLAQNHDIELQTGHSYKKISSDLIIVGNIMSRGMPVIEDMLLGGIPYLSGPAWLGERIAKERQVLAVAGTHGKTTTTALIIHILRNCNIPCGYLLGGSAIDLPYSSDLGSGYFVIEADEYDTAFFDKRSKFIHYHPWRLLINNLEYDHADIFENIDAIQKQFHQLIRTMPSNTMILARNQPSVHEVLSQGVFCNLEMLDDAPAWHSKAQGGRTTYYYGNELRLTSNNSVVSDTVLDTVSETNILAALATVWPLVANKKELSHAITSFRGVTRRMQLLAETNSIKLYEDFAHHPTAIAHCLARFKTNPKNCSVLVELGSNSMKKGAFNEQLHSILKPYPNAIIQKTPVASLTTNDCQILANKLVSPLLNPPDGSMDNNVNNENRYIILMSNKNIDNFRKIITDIIKSYG